MPVLAAIGIAAVVVTAYRVGRAVEFAYWERTNDAPVPESDFQYDPWPDEVRDNVVLDPSAMADPSYLEAQALAAIRHTKPHGGM